MNMRTKYILAAIVVLVLFSIIIVTSFPTSVFLMRGTPRGAEIIDDTYGKSATNTPQENVESTAVLSHNASTAPLKSTTPTEVPSNREVVYKVSPKHENSEIVIPLPSINTEIKLVKKDWIANPEFYRTSLMQLQSNQNVNNEKEADQALWLSIISSKELSDELIASLKKHNDFLAVGLSNNLLLQQIARFEINRPLVDFNENGKPYPSELVLQIKQNYQKQIDLRDDTILCTESLIKVNEATMDAARAKDVLRGVESSNNADILKEVLKWQEEPMYTYIEEQTKINELIMESLLTQ